MSDGMLLFPIGYAPTKNGAVVPGGKLHFTRTGTSTAQDTYSDSALNSANANPVVLNAEGYLDTKIYGDPDTGFNYRVRLTDANDVQIWSVDDVSCAVDATQLGGTNASSYVVTDSGTFMGTLTGYASGPTGVVSYRKNGSIVTLYVATAITGTSNANSLTMTGLSAALRPSTPVNVPCYITDNGAAQLGLASISAAGSSITFYTDLPFDNGGFTTSGTKGIPGGWSITYAI